jgi:hypothetical protein
MSAPFSVIGTSQSQINIEWLALTDLTFEGGSIVTSYHLQWDNNTGDSWFDIMGLSPISLALSTIKTLDVQGGLVYQFRVRAQNIHGWGAYSDSVEIKAAQIPD